MSDRSALIPTAVAGGYGAAPHAAPGDALAVIMAAAPSTVEGESGLISVTWSAVRGEADNRNWIGLYAARSAEDSAYKQYVHCRPACAGGAWTLPAPKDAGAYVFRFMTHLRTSSVASTLLHGRTFTMLAESNRTPRPRITSDPNLHSSPAPPNPAPTSVTRLLFPIPP